MEGNCFLPPRKGSMESFNVWAELPGGYHLNDVDFFVFFIGSTGRVKVKKEDMIFTDEDNYVAMVDTSKTGNGKIMAELHVFLPNVYLESGVKKQIVYVPTDTIVK